MKKLAFVSIFFIFFSGCAVLEPEEITIDRSYNRVILYNNSPYTINIDGFITTSMFPGQGIEFNIPCYGRFKLLATAYRKIGVRKKDGEEVLGFYGQRMIYIYIDGRNHIYKEKSVDYHYEFGQYSFRPSKKITFLIRSKLVCGISIPVRLIN